MAYKKKTFRRKVMKKGRKSYARKPVRKGGIRKIVRKEIARQAENKTSQLYNLGLSHVSSNNLGFNTQNVLDVGLGSTSLSIAQGTGQGQRIGNKIKIKKLTYKGTFVPLPYGSNNLSVKPVQVKLFLMVNRLATTIAPAPQTDMLQLGNGSSALQNDLVDLWADVNTDKYRVLATKQFKLGFSDYGAPAANAYPNVGGPGWCANNDFKLNCNVTWDLTKYYPKTVIFNDNNVDPTTRGLWMVIVYSAADGTQYTATTTAIGSQYALSCQYEDM